MTTYYCPNMEEALRRAKKAGREPGCYFGGITLRSGQRGFAVYRDGKDTCKESVFCLARPSYRDDVSTRLGIADAGSQVRVLRHVQRGEVVVGTINIF